MTMNDDDFDNYLSSMHQENMNTLKNVAQKAKDPKAPAYYQQGFIP